MKRLDPKAKSVIVLVRLSPAMVAALDARADAEGATRSIVLRAALAAALKRKPKKRGSHAQ